MGCVSCLKLKWLQSEVVQSDLVWGQAGDRKLIGIKLFSLGFPRRTFSVSALRIKYRFSNVENLDLPLNVNTLIVKTKAPLGD